MVEEAPVIDSFRGTYDWLSNFARMGGAYPTAEHHYQAHKATSVEDAIWVMGAPTPKMAKRRGNGIACRSDWEDVKIDVMHQVLVLKFSESPMADLLLMTGDSPLIEGNTWGDTFWGVCRGRGQNILGELLMIVRQEIRERRAPYERQTK